MSHPLKVLVVEDDKHMRLLLDHLLRPSYHVILANDGMHAMSQLATGFLPDLIIADIDMPRLNGLEFLAQLRRSGLFSQIPVLILCNPNECSDTILTQGANHVLNKPFNPQLLFKTIEGILPEQQQRASAS